MTFFIKYFLVNTLWMVKSLHYIPRVGEFVRIMDSDYKVIKVTYIDRELDKRFPKNEFSTVYIDLE